MLERASVRLVLAMVPGGAGAGRGLQGLLWSPCAGDVEWELESRNFRARAEERYQLQVSKP